jgi:RHS repeat-associated protein
VTGLAYDAAGNQLTLGGMTGVYDGENRLRTTTTGDFSYDFDAFGRRVRTVAGGKTTCFVYDALGRLTAEYQVGATAGLQTRYLVQDQLGSTRLVTDGSGGVLRRSDYLPYGEEVPSGLGGRTLTGYGADGGVRQAFTGQMRDVETGLDFFGARFYSGALGRFTSPDPLLNSGRPWEPQSWNRYAYTLNNPLRFTDPTGMYEWDSKCKQNDSACEANRQQFRDAVGDLQKAASTFKEGSKERQQLDAILDKIGTEGDGNKTRIAFNSKMSDLGQTFGNKMTFNFKQIDQLLSKWDSGTVSTANAALVGHEGQHLVDGGNMFGGLKYLMSGADRVRKEIGSHTVESYVFQGFNRLEPFGYGLGVQRGDSAGWPLWNPSWAAADAEKLRQTNVGRVIEELYNKKK